MAPLRRIRCVDFPGPIGGYVATGTGFVPFDDESAADLATDAMLLAMSPDHAERLLASTPQRSS